ncbi:RICIN domain-containing protein [Streptomyces sp. NPDC054956]
MTGSEPSGDTDRRDDDRRGNTYRGPAGVQHGSRNLQVNLHEHRTGILSACAVALVCVAVVIAVRMGGDPGGAAATPPAGPPRTNTAPAPTPTPAPGTAGEDSSVLIGRLVNDDGGLCLRVPGTEDGLVPVQDTCTDAADRTWTLTLQDGGVTRTLRNGQSGRCLTVSGQENFTPARQLACTAEDGGQHWKLLWGKGELAGHFTLVNTGTTKCLVVQGRVPDRPATQASCGEEYKDQWWHLDS